VANRRALRSRAPREARRAAAWCGRRRARGPGEQPSQHATRPRASAVAIPSRGQLQGWQRGRHPHSSLLCGRHRVDPGAAVDDRRRSRRENRRSWAGATQKARRRGRRSHRATPRTGLRDAQNGVERGRDAARQGQRAVARSAAGGGSRAAGRRAGRRDREARADGRRLAHALQGRAGSRQARGMGGSDSARRRESRRQGAWLLGKRCSAKRQIRS